MSTSTKSSLKTKLGVGFAGVLGLMVVVGGIGGYAVTNLGKTATEMVQVHGKLSSMAIEIGAHNQGARRYEKEFLDDYGEIGIAKAKEKHGKAVAAEIDAMKRLAAEGASLARTDAERDRFRSVTKAAESYEADFQSVVAAVERRGFLDSGAEGELRAAVHAIEAKLKVVKDSDHLMVQMLNVRRVEKDYLVRGDEKYVAGTAAAVDKLKAAIDVEPGLTPYDRSQMRDLADKYQRAFAVLVDAERAITRALDAPDAASGELAKSAQNAAEAAHAATAAALSNMHDTSRNSISLVALISLIGIAIGSMLSMALARAIVKPIRYLTDVAEKVSLGDTDLTVARQTDDEIGDLAESFGRLVSSLKIMRNAVGEADDAL